MLPTCANTTGNISYGVGRLFTAILYGKSDLNTWNYCIKSLFKSWSCTRMRHRFSAFWLRSKCSICSYQLNIWYGRHVLPSILNWFLQGDIVQELAPALSWVGLVLQYHQDWPTEPHSQPWISLCTGHSVETIVQLSLLPSNIQCPGTEPCRSPWATGQDHNFCQRALLIFKTGDSANAIPH